jgi:hypothetical protein
VNLQRNRWQLQRIAQTTLPGETTKYNFVSQKDNMRYNLFCENRSTAFKDPFGQIVGDLEVLQPKKELLELLTVGNVAQYNHVLENEDIKRAAILEEQLAIRKKLES